MILSLEKLDFLIRSFRLQSNESSGPVWVILTLVTLLVLRLSWAVAMSLLNESKARVHFRDKTRDLKLEREEAELIRRMTSSIRKSESKPSAGSSVSKSSHHNLVISDQKAFEEALLHYVENEDLSTEDKREKLKTNIESIRKKCGFVSDTKKRTMDSTLSLEPNQRVTLSMDSGGQSLSGSVMTRDDIQIRIIPAEGSIIPRKWKSHSPGHAMLRFWRENDAEYKGTVSVLGVENARVPIIVISHTHDLERYQKRKFLRIEVPDAEALLYPLEVHDFTLQTHDDQVFSPPSVFKGNVKDISGGGLCIRTTFPFVQGDIILMDLSIEELGGLPTLAGEVVKSIPQADGSIRISVKFTGIMESTRERIIHYVFSRQLTGRSEAGATHPGEITSFQPGAGGLHH